MSDLKESIAKWLFGPHYADDWQIVGSEVKGEYYDAADSLLALLREHGLVELDENQELPWLPENKPDIENTLHEANFKKVKEIA